MKLLTKMLLITEIKQICFVLTYRQNIFKKLFSDGIFSDDQRIKKFPQIPVVHLCSF